MMRRRRTFLINKKFQFRFAFYVCSWVLVSSAIYPTIIYELFNAVAKIVMTHPSAAEIERLTQMRKDLVLLLSGLLVLFTGATFIISIYLSHRIAGPIFKLRKFLDKVRDGHFKDELMFRKADHFSELAISYNDMLDGVRAHHAKVRGHLERAREHVTDPKAKTELDQAIDWLSKN